MSTTDPLRSSKNRSPREDRSTSNEIALRCSRGGGLPATSKAQLITWRCGELTYCSTILHDVYVYIYIYKRSSQLKLFIRTFRSINIYTYIYIYILICMYLYLYICIYIYKYIIYNIIHIYNIYRVCVCVSINNTFMMYLV